MHGAFARLCTIGFLSYCSYAMCRMPLLPLLARDLGADPPMVGLVVAASTLTGVLLKLPAGAWSDVLGRRPLLLLGTMVFALMPFAYLGIASLTGLIALRFVHGSATAIVGPVASATLSDLAPASRRATWLSTYATVQGVGQACGPVAAGYLIAGGRYDLAFAAAGLIAIATPLLAAGWPASAVPAHAPGRPLGRFTQGIVEVVREPLILTTSVAQAAQFALYGTMNAFVPLFARERFGLDATGLGWLFALQVVTTLATRPIVGAVSDRVGRRPLIVVGLALGGIGVALVSLAEDVPALVAAILLYAVGVAVTGAAASAFITDLTRASRYGAAHGVFGTIYDIGDALGPIAAGLLVASVGYTHTFQVMAAMAILAAGAFHLASRPR